MNPLTQDRDTRTIAVFRALMLGDLLCATPALRALRAGFPRAHIALVGLAGAESLLRRLDSVDEFIAFPGHAGLRESTDAGRSLQRFLADMRAREFDLAIQLHGSGEVTNRLVASFGARRTAGFASDRAWVPDSPAAHFLHWPESGHEIERLLALTDCLGLPRQGLDLSFPLGDDDRRALRAAWHGSQAATYVCIHAGAQLPSRRWGAERFARVADAIAADGPTIVLTGTAEESEVVAAVVAQMRCRAVNLCGRTSLWTLGALIEGAAALVCNDTGVSHIAAALRTPSIVVSCGGDVQRWAPLDHDLHRVLSAAIACRPCGYVECPIGHPCATAVTPQDVLVAYKASPASNRRNVSAAASSSLARRS